MTSQDGQAAPRRLSERKIVLATHNPGKLVEIAELMAPHGLEVVSAGNLGLPEPEETGNTFIANAEPALAAARASGLPPSRTIAGFASQPERRSRYLFRPMGQADKGFSARHGSGE